MASRRSIQAAINLRAALAEMRALYGEHVEAGNLEWLAHKILKSESTERKPNTKCPIATYKSRS